MNSEKYTVVGFALIMLCVSVGVLYNWGYSIGLEQGAAAVTAAAAVPSVSVPDLPPLPQAPSAPASSTPVMALPPTLESVTPSSGAAGTVITLKGEGFASDSYLLINGDLYNLRANYPGGLTSSTEITYKLLKLGKVTNPITIQVIGHTGASNGVEFTYGN